MKRLSVKYALFALSGLAVLATLTHTEWGPVRIYAAIFSLQAIAALYILRFYFKRGLKSEELPFD